jgi:hypothetical protein
MIGLADVRDWLKGFAGAENYYIGTLDSKKPKSLGVYQRKPSGEAHIAIGGLDCTSYDIKQLSLLLHWNKNARETEEKAAQLFRQLQQAEDVTIGGTRVYYIRLMVPEPVDVGPDDAGVYERVIWLDLIYERSN